MSFVESEPLSISAGGRFVKQGEPKPLEY